MNTKLLICLATTVTSVFSTTVSAYTGFRGSLAPCLEQQT